MTGSGSLFRPRLLLLILSGLSMSCGGGDPQIVDPTEVDAAGGTGTTTGAGGAGGGAVTDTAGTFFVDRPPDLPADASLPLDAAEPTPPPSNPGVIVPTSCSEIPCQGLFVAAASCNGDGQMCQSQMVAEGAVVRSNYCLANGVKKQSTSTSTDDGYKTSMRVSGPDGSHCYTLELTGTDGSDQERMFWRSPAGLLLLKGYWSKSTSRLILSCGASEYDPGDLGCPGLEGEPGSDCPAGVCPD
jgi:hypothetical protein